MWLDLKDQISVEEAQLQHLLAVHQPLLHQSRAQAPNVIELSALAAQPYLQFRHVFRNSYSFQLRWEKMRPLVLDCEETFSSLRDEITAFVSRMEERRSNG